MLVWVAWHMKQVTTHTLANKVPIKMQPRLSLRPRLMPVMIEVQRGAGVVFDLQKEGSNLSVLLLRGTIYSCILDQSTS